MGAPPYSMRATQLRHGMLRIAAPWGRRRTPCARRNSGMQCLGGRLAGRAAHRDHLLGAWVLQPVGRLVGVGQHADRDRRAQHGRLRRRCAAPPLLRRGGLVAVGRASGGLLLCQPRAGRGAWASGALARAMGGRHQDGLRAVAARGRGADGRAFACSGWTRRPRRKRAPLRSCLPARAQLATDLQALHTVL